MPKTERSVSATQGPNPGMVWTAIQSRPTSTGTDAVADVTGAQVTSGGWRPEGRALHAGLSVLAEELAH